VKQAVFHTAGPEQHKFLLDDGRGVLQSWSRERGDRADEVAGSTNLAPFFFIYIVPHACLTCVTLRLNFSY